MPIDLEDYYDANFGTAEFWELGSDGFYGKPDSKIAYTIQHIDGTDDNEIADAGTLAVPFSVLAGGAVDGLAALEAKLGDVDTLSIRSGAFTAKLVEITDKKIAPTSVIDGYQAQLLFIVSL